MYLQVQCKARPLFRHAWPLTTTVLQNIRIGEARSVSAGLRTGPALPWHAKWRFPSVPLLRGNQAIHIPVSITFEGEIEH